MTSETKEKTRELNAADLLDPQHPVHKHFQQWLQGRQATKRQARKFLQQFPKYRNVDHNLVA